VVVALGAAERYSKESFGDRFDAVGSVVDEVFLRNGAAFVGDGVVAVEAGGYDLLLGRRGQQVARDLVG